MLESVWRLFVRRHDTGLGAGDVRGMKTIAIIEDDVSIGNMLEEVLCREGYQVRRAYSGTEALLALSGEKPDLVLLDLMLPGLGGEDVLPCLADIPVIVLSAKDSADDKVRMLLSGASDYVTKPFEIRELTARIAVRLREKELRDARGREEGKLEFGDIVMKTSAREVTVEGRPVRLTKTEYAILKLLMRNPAQVITKSALLERISQDTPDCMESSLKVHISNLRRKLREKSGRDYIEAVWGIGFKMKE